MLHAEMLSLLWTAGNKATSLALRGGEEVSRSKFAGLIAGEERREERGAASIACVRASELACSCARERGERKVDVVGNRFDLQSDEGARFQYELLLSA